MDSHNQEIKSQRKVENKLFLIPIKTDFVLFLTINVQKVKNLSCILDPPADEQQRATSSTSSGLGLFFEPGTNSYLPILGQWR